MAYIMKAKATNKSRGVYFDLEPMFHELNVRFFDGKIKAHLRWGQRRKPITGAKRTIRLGSYHPKAQVITINPCLDQAMVPAICLERILFHEMAHQSFPAKKSADGKNLVHYQEFYDFEKTYPYIREADLWLKANLTRLLRY